MGCRPTVCRTFPTAAARHSPTQCRPNFAVQFARNSKNHELGKTGKLPGLSQLAEFVFAKLLFGERSLKGTEAGDLLRRRGANNNRALALTGWAQNQVTIRADVPAFSEKDLEVRVAPRSVCITAKRERVSEQRDEKVVYSERRSNQIFRVLELPGILEIKLLKVGLGRKVPVLAKIASA